MCCDGWDATPDAKAGVCKECGWDVDAEGVSVEAGCNYSRDTCETCGCAPCDQSC